MIDKLGNHNTFPIRMTVSPDGRMGVSGDRKGEIRIWDLVEGKLISRFPGHEEPVALLSFSEDGQNLFSGGHDKLRMWSFKNGAEMRRFVHEGSLRGVAYSPDGGTAISVEEEGVLHMWDLETGNEILSIECLTGVGMWFIHWMGTARWLHFGMGMLSNMIFPQGQRFNKWVEKTNPT